MQDVWVWQVKKKVWITYPQILKLMEVVQGCSNSIANALELMQSCTKPSIHEKEDWKYETVK